jgi:hypothetical protein
MLLFVALDNPRRLFGGTGSSRELRLPPGYSLDLSDPDVLVLRCPTGRRSPASAPGAPRRRP